jgi:hypothetical protein
MVRPTPGTRHHRVEMEADAMHEMREILCNLGVLNWLKERFPKETEETILNKIDSDFSGVIEKLLAQPEGQ